MPHATDFHPNYYEREFLGTKIYYAYNTCKIIDQDNASLEASNNPFAMAVLSAKLMLSRPALREEQLFDQAYDLVKRLLGMQMPKDKIRKVMSFMRYYIHFENPEMIAKFDQKINILTGGTTTMGIEEFLLDQAKNEGIEEGIEKGIEKGIEQGIEKGIEKNTRETALKMIENGLDIQLIANITGLSVEEIEKL